MLCMSIRILQHVVFKTTSPSHQSLKQPKPTEISSIHLVVQLFGLSHSSHPQFKKQSRPHFLYVQSKCSLLSLLYFFYSNEFLLIICFLSYASSFRMPLFFRLAVGVKKHSGVNRLCVSISHVIAVKMGITVNLFVYILHRIHTHVITLFLQLLQKVTWH